MSSIPNTSLIYSTGVDNAGLIAGLAESKQLIARHAADVGKMQFQAPTNIAGGQFFGTHQFVPPASAMNAMIPARGTPGGFASSMGGPSFTGSANAGSGAAAQAISGLAVAVQQATAQLVTMAQAMGAFARVLNAQTMGYVGGGGAGQTGIAPYGAGGPAGRGNGAAPPSAGRLGNRPSLGPFAMFGTMSFLAGGVMRAVGAANESDQEIALTGGDSAAQANAMLAGRKRIGDSVPILGPLVRGFSDPGGRGEFQIKAALADAAGQGSLGNMQFASGIQTSEIVRAARAHTAGSDYARDRMGIQNRLLDEQGRNVQQAGEESTQVGKRFGDRRSALDKLKHDAFMDTDFARVEQIEAETAHLADEERLARKRIVSNLDKRNAAAEKTASFDLREIERRDSLSQREMMVSATRLSYIAADDPMGAAMSSLVDAQNDKSVALNEQKKGRGDAYLRDVAPLERANLKRQQDRSHDLMFASMDTHATVLRAEMDRDPVTAQRAQLEYSMKEARAGYLANGGAAAAGYFDTNVAPLERARLEDQVGRDRRIASATTAARVESSNLRAGRQFFAASVNDYDADTQRQIAGSTVENRQNIIQERAAGRVALGATHQYEVMQERQSLQARQEQAAVKSDMTSPVNVRNAVSGIRGQVAGYQREINAALPENVEMVRKTALAELAAQKAELNSPQSSGFASLLDPSRQMIGDPLHALPATLRIAATNKAIDDAQADVAKQKPLQASDPTLAGFATKITSGLMKMGFLGGGGVGQGDNGGASEGTLKELVGVMNQLLVIARSGQGVGAMFGRAG